MYMPNNLQYHKMLGSLSAAFGVNPTAELPHKSMPSRLESSRCHNISSLLGTLKPPLSGPLRWIVLGFTCRVPYNNIHFTQLLINAVLTTSIKVTLHLLLKYSVDLLAKRNSVARQLFYKIKNLNFMYHFVANKFS